MYRLSTNDWEELIFTGDYGEETIHIVHCADTIEGIKEDAATPYLVAEEATNFPRIHLVTDFSEDEAIIQVAEYLTEKEGEEEPHIIGVFKVEI